jgi:hypothetical protein
LRGISLPWAAFYPVLGPEQHRSLIHRVTPLDFHAPRIEALQLLKPARTVAASMLLPPENVIRRVYAHQ